MDPQSILRKYNICSEDTMVVIGDGDFGFSLSLMKLGVTRIIATEYHKEFDEIQSLDSIRKQHNAKLLIENKHKVLYDVDGTNSDQLNRIVSKYNCNVIWFNCPHVIRECDVMKVENQQLMIGFFNAVP
eukprot:793300_1